MIPALMAGIRVDKFAYVAFMRPVVADAGKPLMSSYS